MGKSTLISLLVEYLRPQGYNVAITAPSAKAARLIGGVTAHSAFKLGTNGFYKGGVHKLDEHWHWLYSADVIIIDEISMLTSSALDGISCCLSDVMTGTRHGGFAYGGKTIILVGDLFQLPAIENSHKEDQVWLSKDWGLFRLLELDEMTRFNLDGPNAINNTRLRDVCSRLRTGVLTDEDFEFLKLRLCSEHCNCQRAAAAGVDCACAEDFEVPFVSYCDLGVAVSPNGNGEDTISSITKVRTTLKYCHHLRLGDVLVGIAPDLKTATFRRKSSCKHTFFAVQRVKAPGSKEVETTAHTCTRCAVSGDGVVIASLREKIDELNEEYYSAQTKSSVKARSYRSKDVNEDSKPATAAETEILTMRLSGHKRVLKLYVGQRVVVTANVNMKLDIINGVLGTIEDLEDGAISVRLENGSLVCVRQLRSFGVSTRYGVLYRTQFPIIPAYAVTVHRVQGSTLEADVHILLNKEFFAAGQAYVAITRVRDFHQLHFWALERSALVADSRITQQYAQLRRGVVFTQTQVDDAMTRTICHNHNDNLIVRGRILERIAGRSHGG
jgi:hypothetical protein